MRYYCNLYLGESIRKKRRKIIRKLNKGKLLPEVYILVLPEGEDNQLEIYGCAQFLQPFFPERDFFVVGIGKGFEEALEIVEEITKEVYNETMGAEIRDYILKKEQEGVL
ncbi:hypothetical protein AALC75_00965 [Lachnospiraceae bacterium 48-42]|jgi:hypothetical protein|nr:hypothetical protein [Dorea sp.]